MMPYEDLEKHFIAPKQISFNCKRVPRKFKKKWKDILSQPRDLNSNLWYIRQIVNKDYTRFLIKQITGGHGTH